MLTDAEKTELDALKTKTDPTDEDKSRLAALEAKAADSDDGQTFSAAYVEQLRKEAAGYRVRAKEAEQKRAAFDGVDVDEYRKLKEDQKAAQKKDLEDQGKWEELRVQLVEDHKGELSKKDEAYGELDKKYGALKGELENTILDNEIMAQGVVHEALNPKVLNLIVKSSAKVVEAEDGKRVIKVFDADGKERINLKTGKPMNVGDLMVEMKSDEAFAHEFKGGTAGASSKTVHGGVVVDNPWKAGQTNLTLQGRLMKENPDVARRFISEAGKDPKVYGL